MQYLPLELFGEIANYLLVHDTEKYCIFADHSAALRLTCKIFYRYLYSKLPIQSILYGPCTSVEEMCPPFRTSGGVGLRSSSPYLTVRGWTSTAKKRCTFHCHCETKHPFERYEVWMMKTLATSLITQIKLRESEFSKFAVLKMPSLEYLQTFHLFLKQCGVCISREMSVFITRTSSPTDTSVIYQKCYDFLHSNSGTICTLYEV